MARRPTWRLAAIVLVGLLAVTVIAALRDDDDGDDDSEPAVAPAQQFLDAMRRSREVTYRSVAEFTRTSNTTGAELRYQLITAQRPPDRLRIDQTGATGLVDGQRLACTFHRERLRCDTAEAQRTYEDDVTRQLDTLAEYVLGDEPLYSTEVDLGTDVGDCYELGLQRRMIAPPLGITSRYCFDPDTGAPTDTRVEAVEAVDVIHTLLLRSEVSDADLDPDTALG